MVLQLTYSRAELLHSVPYCLIPKCFQVSLNVRIFHTSVPVMAMQDEFCLLQKGMTREQKQIKAARQRVCFADAGTQPEEKERGGRGKAGRQGGKERERI